MEVDTGRWILNESGGNDGKFFMTFQWKLKSFGGICLITVDATVIVFLCIM